MTKGDIIKVGTLRLKSNGDGTWTDQYGRLLKQITDKNGNPDWSPCGVDPKGANH